MSLLWIVAVFGPVAGILIGGLGGFYLGALIGMETVRER
jgi:hypothetical protein